MAFDEVRFPTLISYGSRGGPRFLVDVVRSENAHESRVGVWEDSSGTYNARYGVKSMAQLLEVIAFFYARGGMLHGFRYKDWLDYVANQDALVLTGDNTVQLVRNYTSGPRTHRRVIRKPIHPITMRLDAAAYTTFTLDTTTGRVTFTEPIGSANIASAGPVVIDAITQANPPEVTTDGPHGLITGDVPEIADVEGMVQLEDGPYQITVTDTNKFTLNDVNATTWDAYTGGGTVTLPGISRSTPARVRAPAHGFSGTPILRLASIVAPEGLNGLFAPVTVIDADRLTIALDTVGFPAYDSGGVIQQWPQPNQVMDWSGEFDVPVRFDMQGIQAGIEAFDMGDIPDIPMVELLND